MTLLNNAKPHLQSIKAKLGADSSFYLKLSTQVVGNALHNVIEEVNNAQKDETLSVQGIQIPISTLLDRETKIVQVKRVLQAAWNATKIMDTFDMEQNFKINRYSPNRSVLKNMCEQLGVPTTTYTPRSQPIPRLTNQSLTSNSNSISPSKKEPSDYSIALIDWMLIGCIAVGVIALIISRLFDN